MGIIKEFQEFAVKGNVVDMAIGIIIGGAFGTIVKSLVDDIIMPPIGMLLGNVDFSNIVITLQEATADAGRAAVGACAAPRDSRLVKGARLNRTRTTPTQ